MVFQAEVKEVAERGGFALAPFCNSLKYNDLRHKPIFAKQLSTLGCLGSVWMFLHQFDPKQGQIRDKFASFWKDLKGIVGGEAFPFFLLIIGTILPLPSGNGEPGGKSLSGTKGQLEDQLKKTILDVQELHQDYMSKLGEKTDCLGAIYARFSTKHQDSISDQVRKCLEFALKDGIYVPLENIHYDLATKGMKMNRPGLGKIRELLRNQAIKVLLVFGTNRLARKQFKALQLIEEEVIGNKIDCVFVSQNIDTRKKDNWRLYLSFNSMVDELNVHNYSENIRAAQERLFEEGLVTGNITFGYQAVILEGRKTKKGNPARMLEIHPKHSEIVRKIFEWFVKDKISKREITRKLCLEHSNAIAKPWTYTMVSSILANERYIGKWCYGTKKSVWNSKKDYGHQIPRLEPLKSIQKENLRIIQDDLWNEAQARLLENPGYIKGRKPIHEDDGKRPKVLNGFFYCPTHSQLLLVGGYFGRYYYCPKCLKEPTETRPLFTHLSRRLAHKVMCSVAASFIRKIQGVLDLVYDVLVSSFREPPEEDSRKLAEKKNAVRLLKIKIDKLGSNLGETEEDIEESNRILRQLRLERARLHAEISALENPSKQPVPPTKEELAAEFQKLESLLEEKSRSSDPVDQAQLRSIFETLIDGKISLVQKGLHKTKEGYLEGSFQLSISSLITKGVDLDVFKECVTVAFHEKPEHEIKRENEMLKVKELHEKGLMNSQIAGCLGFCRSKVTQLIQKWHQKSGIPYQDGRSRRALLSSKVHKESMHITLAEQAKTLWDENISVLQIASKLGCSAPTVEKALNYWHEARCMKRPNNQERRQELLRRMKDLYDQGKEYQEIGAVIGLCARSVKLLLKDYFATLGITIPDGRSRK